MSASPTWSAPIARELELQLLRGAAKAVVETGGWRVVVRASDAPLPACWMVEPLHDGVLLQRGISSSNDAACRSACLALEQLAPSPSMPVGANSNAHERPARKTG